ncbi:MAG: hypothetical protein JRI52_06750, partial [Deltaproteobacteria bacterium]|nr:hypothetical protein [Deltaproteobacteria bacterium]
VSIRQKQALIAFLSRETVDGVQEFESVFLEEAMDSRKDGSKLPPFSVGLWKGLQAIRVAVGRNAARHLLVLPAKHAEGISHLNMKGAFEYESSRKFQWKGFKFTDRPTFW